MAHAEHDLAGWAGVYAARGLHVLPLHDVTAGVCSCGTACGRNAGKHPRTGNGLDAATADAGTVAAWWARWPLANIGLACAASGLLVVDVDGPAAAEELRRLQRVHGALGSPAWQRTGRGEDGWHLVYRAPADLAVRVGRLAAGLDVKWRGYIVAAPSLHASGQRYRWVTQEPPGHPPAWLLRLLDPPAPPQLPRTRPPLTPAAAERGARHLLELRCTYLAAMAEGGDERYRGRHDAVHKSAVYLGALVAEGRLDEAEVVEGLYRASERNGLVADEGERLVWRTIRDGLFYAGATS